MTLPDLVLQGTYGRLAWAVVFAAACAGLLPVALQRSRRAIALLLATLMVLMLLPGQYSPAYWIALALQWPSALLVGLCLVRLARPWRAAGAAEGIPLPAAAVLALLGILLYLDALGLVRLGLYYWGFGPRAAPLVALALMALCAAGIARGLKQAHLFAMLGALALFAVLRLPTGNLWDALLDPLLWIWAVLSLAMKTIKIKQGVVQW
ncbi:hypothetical protein [Pseudoduganella sp.]|uniref:hypothetical protein n=1 Tax=Pseudoduganella sp. TaxID=1880898 RepID=UPI0035AF2523